MKEPFIRSIGMLAALLMASGVWGATLTYQVTGQVTSFTEIPAGGAPGVNGFFGVGDAFTYVLTYDTATFGGAGTTGSTTYTNGLSSIAFSYSNGYTGSATNGDISVWNDLLIGPTPNDHFSSYSGTSDGLSGAAIGASNLVAANILFADNNSANLFSSLDLVPLSTAFSDYTSSQLELVFQGGGGTTYVKGEMLTISVVPTPAAAWLFGSALIALGWMRGQ